MSGVLLAGTLAAVAAAATGPALAAAIPDPGTAAASAAASAAESAVAARPAELFVGADDTLIRTGVQPGGSGLYYSSYERTYRGLPVIGGDSVVVTNATGAVLTMVAAQEAVLTVDTKAAVSADSARAAARSRIATALTASAPRLVVLAEGNGRLAWETSVAGADQDGRPTGQRVYVDARTGEHVRSVDTVMAGTGNGYYNGTVGFGSSGSGTSFSMADPARPGLRCGGGDNVTYTGADDNWGNGSGTDLETACVDAMYAAGREWDMLSAWAGRNGFDGNGHGYAIWVGFDYVNAYWYEPNSPNPGDPAHTAFGHSSDGQRQMTALDVVGHEIGHSVYYSTPGASGPTSENHALNEGTGDIFGTLTEFYANNPNDPADFDLAEEVDFSGSGPIRRMYDPTIMGDPGCYAAGQPSPEPHAGAGPLDHWFYLLARGNNPPGGPTSPICAGGPASIAGIGLQAAARIWYNALLTKTSSWLYGNARSATLTAAKNLYPGSCAVFNTVRGAWNGVGVGAQPGEPTCTAVTGTFSVSLSPTSRAVNRGSATTVTVNTARTSGSAQTMSLSVSGLPAGVVATFNPQAVNAGATSTLTLSTNSATPTGNFTVTVTGTGTVTRSANLTLTVLPPSCGAPGQKLANPGFESGDLSWANSGNIIGNSGQPAHGGTWFAWLDGYGVEHTDTLSQTVAVPAGCSSYTFSFWLHVATNEDQSAAYDQLLVEVYNSAGTLLATLGQYTNLDAADGYSQKSFNLATYAGQTVELRFTGTEDVIAATSFVVDDATLTVS